ncbi:hypothetical protein LZ575_09370 [Antarcticibacterium sp. 1MA-6-2]|uniref:hypothetical protein n=1 Tax=Antarcticibacterium sp. 1MA-6-2 TaxID=2908210 RepID=UPI001F1E49D0|nr:hypothetical protein [Antarcticibacterium sp. 1MA-6-2]UJH92650.1 hypothetical protein LZ575_09370 [Antarcticibacterium sp. 1MA-6-2]
MVITGCAPREKNHLPQSKRKRETYGITILLPDSTLLVALKKNPYREKSRKKDQHHYIPGRMPAEYPTVKSRRGRYVKSKRQSTVEPVFMTLKEFLGLRKVNISRPTNECTLPPLLIT